MLRSFVVAGLFACAALGCAAEHMHPVAPEQAIPVDPHMATVVFVRPYLPPAVVHYTVVDVAPDGAARFLGESPPTSHFAVSVAPGEHTFVAWGGGAEDAVTAKLAPGRVYFVAILHAPFEVMKMVAVHRGTEESEDASDWIERTTALAPDREAGQRELVQDPKTLQERIDDALGSLKAREADERAERTLGPEDAQ